MICQRRVDSGRTIGRVDTDLLFCILRYNERDPENGGLLVHGSVDPIPASHNIEVSVMADGKRYRSVELANSFSAANAGPPTSPPEARQMPGTM
jgi:hypothetical protein